MSVSVSVWVDVRMKDALEGTNKFVLLRSHGIELDSGVKIVVKERSLRCHCSKDYNLNPGLVRPRRILLTDVEYYSGGGSRRLCRNKDVELPVVRLKQEPMQIIKQAIQSYKRTLCWNISSDLHFQWLWYKPVCLLVRQFAWIVLMGKFRGDFGRRLPKLGC